MATKMTLCGFCRRLTCERTEAGPARGGQEIGTLKDSPLLPDNAMIEDTYCHDCERFYHQLITFGRGDRYAADWNVPDSPIQQSPQLRITTGSPV
ncbi:MAG: hypothetical protein H8J66_04920 [Nitrospira sp.]|nr:hypothetical protein [Nitrospira sp.]